MLARCHDPRRVVRHRVDNLWLPRSKVFGAKRLILRHDEKLQRAGTRLEVGECALEEVNGERVAQLDVVAASHVHTHRPHPCLCDLWKPQCVLPPLGQVVV